MYNTLNKNTRLEWIDAMRGLTMTMVVANHVGFHTFSQTFGASASMPFFVLMRMPMFFFISGFLAYKSSMEWNVNTYCQLIGKKMKIQIIPTMVFFLAFIAISSPNTYLETLIHDIHSPMKGGYWFTIGLLYMFIIYYTLEYFLQKTRLKGLIPMIIIWVLALCAYETCYLPRTFSWAVGHKGGYSGWLHDTSFVEFMKYFHFFIFGNIVHRNWNTVQKMLDNKTTPLVLIALAFFCSIDFLKFHWLTGAWANLPRTIAQYSLFLIVFACFRYYSNVFTKEHRIGRGLQYIGTRTLDVYLLHYFFLPNLPMVGDFFNKYRHNFILDTTAQLIIAIIVIGFCLLVSNVLRMSPFLKKYLFGRS